MYVGIIVYVPSASSICVHHQPPIFVLFPHRHGNRRMLRTHLLTGESGDIELVSGAEEFPTPRLLPGINLKIGGQTFSFSAWVQLGPSFLTG